MPSLLALEEKKEAKEAAAEAKKDAQEAAQLAWQEAIAANSRMQEFLVTLIKTMMDTKHTSSKSNRRTNRPSINDQRCLSPMWQESRRDNSGDTPPERYDFMDEEQENDEYSGDGNSQTPSENSFNRSINNTIE